MLCVYSVSSLTCSAASAGLESFQHYVYVIDFLRSSLDRTAQISLSYLSEKLSPLIPVPEREAKSPIPIESSNSRTT
jgi:hypothetical protein